MERFNRLITVAPDTWNPNSPVEWLKGAILLDNSTGTVLLQLKLCNVSNKHIKSVHLLIDGFDEIGESLCKEFQFAYQDIDQAPHTVFGEQNPIYLPDERIRKVHIHFSKVMFADSTIADIENENLPIPDRESITYWPDNLVNELNRVYDENSSSFHLTYIPKKFDDTWLCSCGKMNTNNQDHCVRCGRDKDTQFTIIDKTYIETSLKKFINFNTLKEIEEKKNKTQKQKYKKRLVILFSSIILFAFCICLGLWFYTSTPISEQIKYNDMTKLKITLMIRKNVNEQEKGSTPLISAIVNNNLNAIDILLKNGANVNQTNSSGNTPFDIAHKGKNSSIINVLLKNGASGYTEENIRLAVGADLYSENVYENPRKLVEKVNADVKTYYEGGKATDRKEYYFTGNNYGGSALGWNSYDYKYVGSVINNTLDGEGSLYVKNGETYYKKYEGGFANGKFSGQGKLYWNMNSNITIEQVIVEGDFQNGNIGGNYQRYFQDGSTNDSGTCINGIETSNKYGIDTSWSTLNKDIKLPS